MRYVLYLNLWGTSAKLLGDQSLTGSSTEAESTLFSSKDLVPCQTHFQRTVTQIADGRELQAFACVDYAYVFSTNLDELVSYASEVFQAMIFPSGRPVIWPLRGAIAEGLVANQDMLIPWMGPGLTKAAELEKSAQKGMRLLCERGLGPSLRSRSFAVRGHEHVEVDWLSHRGYLTDERRARLQRVIEDLMEIGTNYSQQLGASLSGFIKWSGD